MRLPLLAALAALLAGCVSTPPDPGFRTAFDSDPTLERTMTRVDGLPALGYACRQSRCATPRGVVLVNTPRPRRLCGSPDELGTAEFAIRDTMELDPSLTMNIAAERPPTRFRRLLNAGDMLVTARIVGTRNGMPVHGTAFFACSGARMFAAVGIATTAAEAEALAVKALPEAARQPI